VLNGKSEGRELKVPYDEFLVGRAEECHLRPKSDAISRHHCVIRVRDDQAFVEDLGSRNGTYINGVRTVGEQPLSHGALLKIGKLDFEVVLEESPAKKAGSDSTSAVDSDESWADDKDITKWLEEGGLANAQGDPETRQFRLDETERAALETTATNQAATQTTVAKSPDSKSDSSAGKPKEKKKPPGKLPPVSNVKNSENSREAAADMLKRFFNRP
jgi:pSer/pThr/pTyr-binding forkhead associated (FHA) protein